MNVIAIDPGTHQSGVVIWDGEKIGFASILPNNQVLLEIRILAINDLVSHMVIEQVRSYGKPVGQEVFDTCVWCGKFEQQWNTKRVRKAEYLPRIEVKKHLCYRHIAKDAEVRQVLIDRFGAKPTKAKPNPVYGEYKLKKDEWQAFALAVAYYDRKTKES